VVLYPDEVFQDVTKMPGWVGALNDGKIRFPIKGLTFVDHTVGSILKHELTHSFIRLKTAGNCPLWLNEGLAQYLSGDSGRSFLPLAKKPSPRNASLNEPRGPFIGMEPTGRLGVPGIPLGYGVFDKRMDSRRKIAGE
jgi:hypothetical protein